MRCAEARGRLHLQVDDELHPDDGWRLERHLESCESCRQRAWELREVCSLLAEVGSTDRRQTETTRSDSKGVTRRWSAAAASLLMSAAFFLSEHIMKPPTHSDDTVQMTRTEPQVSPPELTIEIHNKGLLAVNLPSRNPDVHIVWLYPVKQKGTQR